MRRLAAVLLCVTVCGCGPIPQPIVDLKSTDDPVAYQQDYNDCWVLVQRHFVNPEIGAMAGPREAASGAIGAGVSGIVTGASSSAMATGVVAGAVGGFIAGPMLQARLDAIGNSFWVGRCLENRGYEVLNADDVRITPYKFCMMTCPDKSGWSCSSWAEEYCVPGEEARLERLKREREERRVRSSQRPVS
jgi:hypothetical protein